MLEEHNPVGPKQGTVGVIYGLLEAGGPVRYVGATRQHPAVRILSHRSSRPKSLRAWLKAVGPRLRYVILEEVPEGEDITAAEQMWYERLEPYGGLLNLVPPRNDYAQNGSGNYRSRRRGSV